MHDRLLTAREVAERLNISRSYVYYLVSIGELPSIRIRRAIRVQPRALEKFIAERDDLQMLILGRARAER